ncbi:MAG: hypothetical protein ABJO01_10120 [Parasphingorhabdus sp.]|uniref:hypothetical protein n=1 Tax=Parasphingorhabdus sp. TaxID=2709688 RepID=UPI0032989D1F
MGRENLTTRINFDTICVDPSPEGASRLFSFLAKPQHPGAPLRKLQNWLSLNGLDVPREPKRSKKQINEAAEDVLFQVQRTIKCGDVYVRALWAKGVREKAMPQVEYARPLNSAEITERNWSSRRSVVHIAAGLRMVMFQRQQGLTFFRMGKPVDEQMEDFLTMLRDDYSWIKPTFEASMGHLHMANCVQFKSPKKLYIPLLIEKPIVAKNVYIDPIISD